MINFFCYRIYLNFIKITFNCVCNIFAIEMHRNQSSNIIFHFPFVVDDIFQFNLGAAMVVRTSTSHDDYVSTIRFICILFTTLKSTKLKMAEKKMVEKLEKKKISSYFIIICNQYKNDMKNVYSYQIAQNTYTFLKVMSSTVATIFDVSITCLRIYW